MRVVYWNRDLPGHDPRVLLHDGERYVMVAFAWDDRALWAWSGSEIGPCCDIVHEYENDERPDPFDLACGGPILEIRDSVAYASLDDQPGGWRSLDAVYDDMERLIDDPSAWMAERVL